MPRLRSPAVAPRRRHLRNEQAAEIEHAADVDAHHTVEGILADFRQGPSCVLTLALQTRMSISPRGLRNRLVERFDLAAHSLNPAGTASVLTPATATSRAVLLHASFASLLDIATSAPASCKLHRNRRPMPWLAPVIRARLPASEKRELSVNWGSLPRNGGALIALSTPPMNTCSNHPHGKVTTHNSLHRRKLRASLEQLFNLWAPNVGFKTQGAVMTTQFAVPAALQAFAASGGEILRRGTGFWTPLNFCLRGQVSMPFRCGTSPAAQACRSRWLAIILAARKACSRRCWHAGRTRSA